MAIKKTPEGQIMHMVDTAFDPVAAALKQMHEAVTNEELPDDFMRILAEIDAKIEAETAPPPSVQ